MNKEVLARPFPASFLKQRQGANGKLYTYVEVRAVIARLNEASDEWDFHVERYEVLPDEVVVLGKLVIERTVTKFSFGGSAITRDRAGQAVSIADDLKSAASDALKKAASLLGVGLELYGPATQGAGDSHAPAEADDRLTQRQHSAIQSVAQRNHLASAELARLVEVRFRKPDLGHLTRGEASQLLTELSRSGGTSRH